MPGLRWSCGQAGIFTSRLKDNDIIYWTIFLCLKNIITWNINYLRVLTKGYYNIFSAAIQLFTKVSDAVLVRAFREIGLKTNVLKERGNSADVQIASLI
jgi:hypothetical protein